MALLDSLRNAPGRLRARPVPLVPSAVFAVRADDDANRSGSTVAKPDTDEFGEVRPSD